MNTNWLELLCLFFSRCYFFFRNLQLFLTSNSGFTASGHLRRQLAIRWVKDEAWIESLQESLKDGGCVAVICSTVDRAQGIFQQLQVYFSADELGLFHGRFLFVNREKIEQDCLAKFGKDGKRPKRFILIATQVIEQSLDVDFDLMISDLAPIDLLLQRSGRLHRHTRDYRPQLLQNPTLWLIKPTWDEKDKIQFGDSGYIYDRHVLLRSWLSLRNRDTIQLPEETDSLIEFVYDLELEIPANLEDKYVVDWQNSLDKYQTEEKETKKTKADGIKLPPPTANVKPDQFTRRGEEDDDSTIAALTRLGESSVMTIFLQQTESGLILPKNNYSINLEETPKLATIRELLAHSTRISKRGLVHMLMAQKNPEKWASALLRHCRYVILDDEKVARIGEWQLKLEPLLGVVITKEN